MMEPGDKMCKCGDRHWCSPLHKPGCPRYDPAYVARMEAREARRVQHLVVWDAAPRPRLVREARRAA